MGLKLYLTNELQTQNPYLLNTAANFLLTPVRHFTSGKIFVVYGDNAFDMTPNSWEKTALLTVGLIVGTIPGIVARYFSLYITEVQNGFDLVGRISVRHPSSESHSESDVDTDVSGGEEDSAIGSDHPSRDASRSPSPTRQHRADDATHDDHLDDEDSAIGSDHPSRDASRSPSPTRQHSVDDATHDDHLDDEETVETTTAANLSGSSSVGLPGNHSSSSSASVENTIATKAEKIVMKFDPAKGKDQLRKEIGLCIDLFTSVADMGDKKVAAWLTAASTKADYIYPFYLCSNLSAEETSLRTLVGNARFERLERTYKEAQQKIIRLGLQTWLTEQPPAIE